eukprot:11161160-Heterocapsa_arctica.AAC.1
MPADGPSRKSHVPPPRQPLPAWLDALEKGDFEEFDAWTSLPKQKRAISEWARFVARFALSDKLIKLSPKDCPSDPTLGYPEEGPRRPAARPL